MAAQIAHLTWTDEQALLAATDPQGFARALAGIGPGLGTLVDDAAAQGAREEPARLLGRWREGRRALADRLAALPEGTRLPWFGPPMSAASMASARLMETWAHGLDVTDALGLAPSESGRLRHIAHIGGPDPRLLHVTRAASASGAVPGELTAPDGASWGWGPEDAAQRVTGPALDSRLRVTRRRHPADLHLEAAGPDAQRWLEIAQAFAGPPGADRPPSRDRRRRRPRSG